MLSKRIESMPAGEEYIFEPKWDGFRTLVFKDGDEIFVQSREGKPLARYFPELLPALQDQLPLRCVLDGEIVIASSGGLDFDALQLRLHPAASRVKLLAGEMPSSVVFFDLLCEDGEDLRNTPFEHRRERLEKMLAKVKPPLHLTPATTNRSLAADWFKRFEGAGLDGVMAKPKTGIYEPDKRVMLKMKHERDCDCAVAGFRWHKDREGEAIGSLLLGLFDYKGAFHHVGVCSSFAMARRVELVDYLKPYRSDALKDHPWREWAEHMSAGQRMPGGQSRWSQGKDLSWEPLRLELVAEVTYEHMQGMRFRHMAHFQRWRLDKPVQHCTYAQLEVVPAQELMEIFGAGR
jgi:ATP-dependent DNA ligase